MKIFGIVLISLSLFSCSEGQFEELVFRTTLKFSLVELCGEEDKECITAVKSQVSDCMKKSDWRKYLNDQDNQDEFNRFTKAFYSCIVDENGDPYFEPNIP